MTAAQHWFVDPLTGDDANDGRGTLQAPRALRTFARLRELLPIVTVDTTVYLLNDAPAGDPYVPLLIRGNITLTLAGHPPGAKPRLHFSEGEDVSSSKPRRIWCGRCDRTLAVWRGEGLTYEHVGELAVAHGCGSLPSIRRGGSRGVLVQDVNVTAVSEADARGFEAALLLMVTLVLALVGCGGGAFGPGEASGDAGGDVDAGEQLDAPAAVEAAPAVDAPAGDVAPAEGGGLEGGPDVDAGGDPCAVDTSSPACAAHLVDLCCREHVGGICCLARASTGAYQGSTPCGNGSFTCAAGSCGAGGCAPMEACWYGSETSSDGSVSYADVGQVVLCE